MDSVGKTEKKTLFANTPALDWSELFGNDRPIEIEVGSGKGAFLLAAAQARPQRNFLGIEVQARWVKLVHQRLTRHALPNARILHADAGFVIRNFVPDASVSAYHVYFPDPWWKQRHRKRLFMRPDVVRALRRTLRPGGHLHVTTDVADRFDGMMKLLGECGFREIPDPDPNRPVTNFERKYRLDGRPLYRATLDPDPDSIA